MNQQPRFRWITDHWQLIRPYGRYAYYGLRPEKRPGYFSDAWARGSKRIGLDPLLDLQKPAPDQCAFLFFPMVDWHARTQRSQHLAVALAKLGATCFYISPHLGLEYEKPFLMDSHTRLCPLGPNLYELHIHLPREHAIHERSLRKSETARVTNEIQKFLDIAGIESAVSMLSLPVWLDVCKTLRESHGIPMMYDCHDWLPGFERLSAEIVQREDELLKACDHAAFSSQHLMDSMIARVPSVAAKSAILRNGVSPRHFGTYDGLSPSPSNRSGVVGYAGALDHWFDVDAVMEAAKTHPELKFELLGRVEDGRIEQLRSCSNIRLGGEVPYGDLPKYLRSWDVGMIPFLRTPLTLATNPIKLYEYFAAGLPVVSTRLPEIEIYDGAVYIAGTPAEFGAKLTEALRENDPKLRAMRMAIAERETWDVRAADMLKKFSLVKPVTVTG